MPNPTFSLQHRLKFIVILICTITLSLNTPKAQTSPIMLYADEALRLSLRPDAALELIYTAESPQHIALIAQAMGDDLADTVLIVLNPQGQQIAYQDDTHALNPDGSLVIQRDAQFQALYLPQAGTYLVRVDSFNGVSAGEVELRLNVVDPFQARLNNEGSTQRIEVHLPRSSVYAHHLEVNAGDTLTITARDLSGTLDPVIALYDADETIIATNDDHGSSDLKLDVLDARLSITLVESGSLYVQVSDFLGRQGQIELIIQHANGA